jgi:tetratricopeptide (TPR) repeat protein
VRFARAACLLGAAAYTAAGALAQDEQPPTQPGYAAAVGEDLLAPAASEPRVITRFEAELEIDRLVAAEQYAEAAEVGVQWVPLTEAEFGPQSNEAANAYRKLADVQHKLGEYATAEGNYLQALSIYRETAGPVAEILIEPLLGLGDNYQASGQYTNAVSAYAEARTVSRRAYGLLNEGQIEMLDRLTESYESMDQLIEAHTQQLEALNLVERNHDPASPEVLAAIYKYGNWLRGAHRYTEEREQYFRAERLVRQAYGDDSELLVRPLLERAVSFRVQGAGASQGISGLHDALEILEAQENPDPLLLAEVLRDIGDWDVAFGRVGTEGVEYLRSWRLLGEAPNGQELRLDWYGGIEFLLSAPMSRRGLTDDPQAPRGRVLVRFDINRFGQAENVTIVTSQPPGFKDEAVARHIRQSRFRPNMQDGELVAGRNKALDIVFRYLPGETGEQQD